MKRELSAEVIAQDPGVTLDRVFIQAWMKQPKKTRWILELLLRSTKLNEDDQFDYLETIGKEVFDRKVSIQSLLDKAVAYEAYMIAHRLQLRQQNGEDSIVYKHKLFEYESCVYIPKTLLHMWLEDAFASPKYLKKLQYLTTLPIQEQKLALKNFFELEETTT